MISMHRKAMVITWIRTNFGIKSKIGGSGLLRSIGLWRVRYNNMSNNMSNNMHAILLSGLKSNLEAYFYLTVCNLMVCSFLNDLLQHNSYSLSGSYAHLCLWEILNSLRLQVYLLFRDHRITVIPKTTRYLLPSKMFAEVKIPWEQCSVLKARGRGKICA